MPDESIVLPLDTQERAVIGWLEECLEEGESFVRAQVGYEKIQPTIDSIMGKQRDLKPSMLSSTTFNYLGKCASDLASLMTDTKPFWTYKTRNRRYEQSQVNLGRLATHWWLYRHQDQRLSDAIKYCLAGASSFCN